MIWLGAYLAVFILWMVIELLAAPKGYEDEKGFHYGNPPEKIKKFGGM